MGRILSESSRPSPLLLSDTVIKFLRNTLQYPTFEQDNWSCSALYHACTSGQTYLVRLFIEVYNLDYSARCDFSKDPPNGLDCLGGAILYKNDDVVSLFAKSEGDKFASQYV